MERKAKEKKIAIKMVLSLVYLAIITILFICAYKIFEEKRNVIPWSEVETVEDYTYIEVSKMSEKFAYFSDTNIGLHFVIETEDTGLWHTYIIAIDEDDYDSYKNIIDYTYERIDRVPNPKKVYGYPVITTDEIKELAIKNIPNFVPAENEVVISKDNYDAYLTNSYLDTTRGKKDNFNILLFVTLLLIVILIIILFATLIGKDKIVDKIDNKLDKEIDRAKFMYQRAKEKQQIKRK